MTQLTTERHRPFGPKAQHFREQLRLYPHLGDAQVEELVSIYSQLTILEVGLLSADEQVATRFDAFVRDHSDRLRSPWQQHMISAIVVVGALALVLSLAWAAMAVIGA